MSSIAIRNLFPSFRRASHSSLEDAAAAWKEYMATPDRKHYARMSQAMAGFLPSEARRDMLAGRIADPLSTDAQHYYWDVFGKLCKDYWQQKNPAASPSIFATVGVVPGQFSPAITQDIIREMECSSPVSFTVDDSAAGYYHNTSTIYDVVDRYNEIFIFKKPSATALAALTRAIESIHQQVETELKSHFRIVQVRYWEVKPGGEGIGTNGWHTDGFPNHAFKILSFFSDYDTELGTTQFKLLDKTSLVPSGKAGGWFLFQNSAVEHCGLPPTRTGWLRKTFEITLGPSLATDCTAIFAGTNGHYPMRPWYVMPA